MGHSRFLFGLFKQKFQFLQQINAKKCPSSIKCWDSNPRPSEHESPPITTRPGLRPLNEIILLCSLNRNRFDKLFSETARGLRSELAGPTRPRQFSQVLRHRSHQGLRKILSPVGRGLQEAQKWGRGQQEEEGWTLVFWPTPVSFCLYCPFQIQTLNKNFRLILWFGLRSSDYKASLLTTWPWPRPNYSINVFINRM